MDIKNCDLWSVAVRNLADIHPSFILTCPYVYSSYIIFGRIPSKLLQEITLRFLPVDARASCCTCKLQQPLNLARAARSCYQDNGNTLTDKHWVYPTPQSFIGGARGNSPFHPRVECAPRRACLHRLQHDRPCSHIGISVR